LVCVHTTNTRTKLSDLRIVYFDEVGDPYQITLLLQLSLHFSATPEYLQKIRVSDDRYAPEFGIFAVDPNGTVVAGHLLMHIATETINGRLHVGGVNAVGTRPDFTRRGIMTRLMTRTHEYFIDRDLEYSVLTTSDRLVAALLYEKLGYVELDRSRIAVKYPTRPRAPVSPDVSVRPFSEEDRPIVTKVFRAAVAGSYGFIHRPHDFLKARNGSVDKEIRPAEKLRIARRGRKPTGYAYWEPNPRVTEAYEILALDSSSFQALLADAETRRPNTSVWVWCDGLTRRELDWLKNAGYEVPIEAYGRALIKYLNGKTHSARMKKMYGVDAGNFRLGIWDGT
jgi:GNAT superfamily N-acetyltransferase